MQIHKPSELRVHLSRETFRSFISVPSGLWVSEIINPIRDGTYSSWREKWLFFDPARNKDFMTAAELKKFIEMKLSYLQSRVTWMFCLAALCEDINQDNSRCPSDPPVMSLEIAQTVLGYDPVEDSASEALFAVPKASIKFAWFDFEKEENEFFILSAWRYLKEKCRREKLVRTYFHLGQCDIAISTCPIYDIYFRCYPGILRLVERREELQELRTSRTRCHSQ
jgi:hypothetical protein